jgi:thiol:disulfide interchange protein DsbD
MFRPAMRALTPALALTMATTAAGCGPKKAAEAPAADPEIASVGDEASEPEIPENLVRLYLLADVTAVSPGQELTVAARLDIEPSWHIYWINPGEAGLATAVEFTAPDGFEIGPTRYPGPVKFDGEGDVVSYGYKDLVLLSARVVAPDRIEGEIEIAAAASWLACREMCIEGSARTTTALAVASADRPSEPRHREVLARHEASLPRPLVELEGAVATAAASPGPTLTIRVPGADRAEYFPSTGEQLAMAGQAAVPADGGVELLVSYRTGITLPERAGGVIAVWQGGEPRAERRYYQIDQSLKEQP